MRKSKIITNLCWMIILCFLLSACGSTETSNEVVDTEVSNVTEEIKNTESTPIYEEGTDVFLISNNVYGQEYYDGNLIDMNSLEPKGGKFLTEKEVSIYDQRKVNVGYIKSEVTITMSNQSDEWSYVYVTDGGYFVRTEDLNSSTSVVDISTNLEKNENTDTSSEVNEEPTYTVTDMNETMYAKSSVNIRKGPGTEYDKVGSLTTNTEVTVTGKTDNNWYRINYNGTESYVSCSYLVDEKVVVNTTPSNNGGSTNEGENNSGGEYIPPTNNDIVVEEPTYAYTAEEVIAIVESTLRNAGFVTPAEVYAPEILEQYGPSGGMGWGLEYVPMDDPYTYANSMVEGAVYWGYNMYYLEYQSIENGCVVLVSYWGTNE